MNLRDTAQEIAELGPRGTLFRIGWELKGRAGFYGAARTAAPAIAPGEDARSWTLHLPIEDPISVARHMRGVIPQQDLNALRLHAENATHGRILCFGRRTVDFGSPIDWHRNPTTGTRSNPRLGWVKALAEETNGDVKHIWEVARFPHAYHLSRAAAFFPDAAERYAESLVRDIAGFVESSSPGEGIHWASGQETGFRLLAWLFALDTLLLRTDAGRGAERLIADGLAAGALHIERHIDYARIAVYNNHLLSEALALFGTGVLLPESADTLRWRELGRTILDAQAERQFYSDGGYIQQSHNYHRVALQNYLWACAFAKAMGDRPSPSWLGALERSLDLLVAHQNPSDGRLPNYGSNDGALPSILSTCDFSDLRPVLQAVSVLVRGERIYDSGPWDETTAWFLGVRALDAPLKEPARTSVSFGSTGYHVLRGRNESSFSAFRCGSLRDRFSQIDMLHLDLWWRGVNVLVDPGSYQYNAAPRWHEHFMRTASHNTLTIDGRDQMLHHRQFKVLYWTKARLQRFTDEQNWALCAGEHTGYRRHSGGCVHQRSVLFVKDDLWVVIDRVDGAGEHSVRPHWLGGPGPWIEAPDGNGMDLQTAAGIFTVRLLASDGSPVAGDVAAGVEEPARGWLSRYYGEKTAVPSFAAVVRGAVPMTLVSILAGTPYDVEVDGTRWNIETPANGVSFDLGAAGFESLTVQD